MNAAEYIEALGLTSHVEGGAFRETYRSERVWPDPGPEFSGDKSGSTAIYFLLKFGQISAFHKIASDELWHFYDGDPIHIYEITSAGALKHHVLGKAIQEGQSFQVLIPGGSWFASRCETPEGFGLCGCTVSPGFDFDDFILAKRSEFQTSFPAYAELIEELTYPE